jgi:hypothetical protein
VTLYVTALSSKEQCWILDQYRHGLFETDEDDTTSGLDLECAGSRACTKSGPHLPSVAGDPAAASEQNELGKCTNEGDSPEPSRKTFDIPSRPCEGPMPSRVPVEETFDFIIGCEILYEMPHAVWVPAAIKTRLDAIGQAIVIGAVRDSKV